MSNAFKIIKDAIDAAEDAMAKQDCVDAFFRIMAATAHVSQMRGAIMLSAPSEAAGQAIVKKNLGRYVKHVDELADEFVRTCVKGG